MNDVTLSPAEIERLSGGYKRPADQLRELHRQGFYRARLGRVTREVILERAHYDEVSRGGTQGANRPQVRQPRLRAVT